MLLSRTRFSCARTGPQTLFRPAVQAIQSPAWLQLRRAAPTMMALQPVFARQPLIGRSFTNKAAEVPAPPKTPVKLASVVGYISRHHSPSLSFEQLGLSERLQEALQGANIDYPTEIQTLVIPKLLQGESLLFSSQTGTAVVRQRAFASSHRSSAPGTGKTLAYLLPLVQRLRQQEAEGLVRRQGRPRALILVPSRELALQVQVRRGPPPPPPCCC